MENIYAIITSIFFRSVEWKINVYGEMLHVSQPDSFYGLKCRLKVSI